jgi:hypothetical protein
MDANLNRRVEQKVITVAQLLKGSKKISMGMPKAWIALVMMGLVGLIGCPVNAFTTHKCTNRSNFVESHSLLEPDACVATDCNGEVKMTVYGEIVQIEQERITPIFWYQVM